MSRSARELSRRTASTCERASFVAWGDADDVGAVGGDGAPREGIDVVCLTWVEAWRRRGSLSGLGAFPELGLERDVTPLFFADLRLKQRIVRTSDIDLSSLSGFAGVGVWS